MMVILEMNGDVVKLSAQTQKEYTGKPSSPLGNQSVFSRDPQKVDFECQRKRNRAVSVIGSRRKLIAQR